MNENQTMLNTVISREEITQFSPQKFNFFCVSYLIGQTNILILSVFIDFRDEIKAKKG